MMRYERPSGRGLSGLHRPTRVDFTKHGTTGRATVGGLILFGDTCATVSFQGWTRDASGYIGSRWARAVRQVAAGDPWSVHFRNPRTDSRAFVVGRADGSSDIYTVSANGKTVAYITTVTRDGEKVQR